ncbi:MAG: RHS repeat-associated core domain-containing protein [Bacteroidota bacterium]
MKIAYPFGMAMPGRTYCSGNDYRYGFNGKEKDKDDGLVQYDYGFRIYDPRLGKFKSVDPLKSSYPYYTPYQFAGNMPIAAIDLDGLEQYVVIYYKDKAGKTTDIQVVAITDNSGELLNQHIHRVGETKDIAKGNVLVFESYQQKNGNENLKIVSKRNTSDSKLNPDELKIYKNRKKLQKESGETQSLGYGGNPDGPPDQYVSQDFENSETKTYSATFGIVAPPAPPSTPLGTSTTPTPPTPVAPGMPGVLFDKNGSSWTNTKTYDAKIKGVANWLISNPGYNLQITSGGVGSGTSSPSSWDEKIPGTSFFGLGGTTYGERIDNLFEKYKKDILKAAGSKIAADRLSFQRDKVGSSSIKTQVIKK